jgi:hypothetical protein
MSRTKSDALSVIYKCAEQFNVNLANRNLLFVGVAESKAICFEALFLPQNFLHLTGLRTNLAGGVFFQAAIALRVSVGEIGFAKDGTTEMKLDILPRLMNIHTTARMIGDFNQENSMLVTDKLAGTVTAAMGFKEDENGFYFPNTALKTDLRLVTKRPQQRVTAILVKDIHSDKYSKLTYIARGLSIDDDILKPVLVLKADMQNLTADFEMPRAIT